LAVLFTRPGVACRFEAVTQYNDGSVWRIGKVAAKYSIKSGETSKSSVFQRMTKEMNNKVVSSLFSILKNI